MLHLRSAPDFLAFHRSLKSLYGMQRTFAKNAAAAQRIEVEYRKEILNGLAIAERFLPKLCDQNGSRSAAYILKLIGRGESASTAFDLSSAVTAFKTIAQASALADAKLFPISGTLLGLVREGGLLQHDYDLDFGIMNEDREGYWNLIEILQNNPEIASIRYYWPTPLAAYVNREMRAATTIPMKTSLRFHSGVTVDLGNHFIHQGLVFHGSAANLWKHKQFTLAKSFHLGVDVYLPKEPERYLEENYGDWRTPKLDYVYFLDTPNWSPAVSAAALRLYVGNALRLCAQRHYARVERIVCECIPAVRDRAMERLQH